MEDEFLFRDYNYAVEPATVDEIRPNVVREFITRMDKLFLQVPELQPRLRKIHKRLKDDIDDLQPIDDIRQDILVELVKTEEKDSKVKTLLSRLKEIIKELELPELNKEEKESL